MSDSPFTPAQREVLVSLGQIIGTIFGAYIHTQNRLAGIEELLKERRIVTDEEIAAAHQRADERWQSGLMIDSFLDKDLYTMLEELRRRLREGELE
jgi:hypothetical protein